jgi:valyl-tRNA synthetase
MPLEVSFLWRLHSNFADLNSGYKPSLVEAEEFECYSYFKPKVKANASFSLILPPPNITGNLHLGHALTATVQDVIVRWYELHNERS